jgi:cyclophilin family peptidyl-prolyl cis-trans isomerase
MYQHKLIKQNCAAVVIAAFMGFFASPAALATVVRFNTTLGTFDVRLYNGATPLTVANFLGYSQEHDYDATFIHRSIPGFIVQGGGFYYNGTSLSDVPEHAMVHNEPGISNLRGTIAMAKLPAPAEGGPANGGPNSATNEWFFNVANNSSNLDAQNGGFTVFGRVLGGGMSVVDAINALQDYDLDGMDSTLFDAVPLKSNSGTLVQNLIYINSVTTLNYPKGDYDFNGVVNANDYTVWKNSFGSTAAAEADGNGDGKVNAADYTIWRDSLNQMGGPGSGAAAGVPEPRSLLLALSTAPMLWLAARRKIRTRLPLSSTAEFA